MYFIFFISSIYVFHQDHYRGVVLVVVVAFFIELYTPKTAFGYFFN